jgi:O-antigen/teichoic acid export membrane protein
MPGTPTGKPQSAARGALSVIALRWTDRLIGVISTLILARLLLPEDFGIVAMASLVVALTDTLLDLGVNSALVQNRDADRHDFDTAWTLRILQNTVAALAIAIIGAPLAADYFNDERVVDVLRLMSLSLVVGGIENIGIVSFQKNMEFDREFRFFFLRRMAGFLVTVALAVWLRSYWAMIIGTLAGRISGVALSYWMHEFRPRLALSRFSKLWSFSQWILVRNIGTYGAQQVDKIIVGRRGGASTLGAYTLADEIAAMPTGELLAPLGRVLFPAFVRVASDAAELVRVFKLALGVQVLVALPAGVGLALVAPQAVPLLLGAQWTPAVPLVQILALVNVTLVFTNSSGYLLLTVGRVRPLAMTSWLQFGLLAGLAILALPAAGATGIAMIRLAVAAVAVVVILFLALRAVRNLRVTDLMGAVWRPALATIAMAVAIHFFRLWIEISTALVRMLADITLGAVAYSLALLLLWRFAACPEGAEAYLLERSGIRSSLRRALAARGHR